MKENFRYLNLDGLCFKFCCIYVTIRVFFTHNFVSSNECPMLRSMLAKKFKGCLMGALLGDCFGGPFEGDLPQHISKAQLQLFFDKLEGPAYKSKL